MHAPFIYRPVGGIGGALNPQSYEETQVAADSANWLFEDGRAYARSQVNNFVWGNRVDFGRQWFNPDSVAGYYFLIFDDGALGTTAGTLTGPGTSFAAPRVYHNATMVNGAVIAGNHPAGMIRNVRGTTTYTVQSNAKYRYFTSHISRAVAAYDITSGSEDEKVVAWSAVGDEDDWTAASAGNSTLSEISDEITGIATIDHVLVIFRLYGIHLGFPSGTTPPFNFRNFIPFGPGCCQGSTIADYNNELFFLGRDQVYRFHIGSQPRPIAPVAIRDELLRGHAAGTGYQGFIELQHSIGDSPLTSQMGGARARYHLVPIGPHQIFGPDAGQTKAHYSFDLESETWARHTYPFEVRAAFWGNWEAAGTVYIIADDSVGTTYTWSTTTPTKTSRDNLNEPARLRSRPLIIGDDPTQEFHLDRVLLLYRLRRPILEAGVDDAVGSLVFTVSCQQAGQPRAVEQTINLFGLESDNTDEWRTLWVDVRITGQFFVYTIEVPSDSGFEVEQITGQFIPSAKVKARAAA